MNNEGEITHDTGWVAIQVGSVAVKPTWQNYSALELEATCVVWNLETLAYYLKGCLEFDLLRDMEAIQAYNVRMSFVKGVHNHISNALSRSPVGGLRGLKES